MAISFTVRTDKIGRVQASIQDNAKSAVKDSAVYMRDLASAIAPRRTGAFAASMYVSGPGTESDYNERAAEARDLNPEANILPEANAATVDPGVGQLRDNQGRFSRQQAIVSSAVEYALYLEEGTRYMAPQPTLHEAAEGARAVFINAMQRVAD